MNSDFDFNILDSEIAEIDIDMSEFGFDSLDVDSDMFGTDFSLSNADKGNIEQITFFLSTEQMELVRRAMELVKDDIYETYGNDNKNGNAIYEVVRQWVELKKL